MVGHFGLDSAELSSQREIAIVLVLRDCSQTFPSRGTTHVYREELCLVVADADVSCANSSPYEPLNTGARAIDSSLAQAITSKVTFELAQTGGISSCTGQLGSNNLR